MGVYNIQFYEVKRCILKYKSISLAADNGAVASDREFESMAVQGMDKTMREFYTIKADSMSAKNLANNIIGTTGMLRLDDIPIDKDDSLSKNLMNVYMIGAHINSNLLNEGNYTQYTLRRRNRN